MSEYKYLYNDEPTPKPVRAKVVTAPPEDPAINGFLGVVGIIVLILGLFIIYESNDPMWGIIITVGGCILCTFAYYRHRSYTNKREKWRYSLPDEILIAQLHADSNIKAAEHQKQGMFAIAGGLTASRFLP